MTLLDEIYKEIKEANIDSNIHLHVIDFLKFIIPTNISKQFADDSYYYKICNSTDFSRGILIELSTAISKETNWSLQRLNECMGLHLKQEQLFPKLKNLCHKHNINAPDNSFSSIMKALVYNHFFGIKKIDILFPEYRYKTPANYVEWTDKEQELSDLMNNHKIIFISGRPGSGKKWLVKHVISKFTPKKTDIYVSTSPTESIETHIEEIEFGAKLCKIDVALNNLKRKDEKSVLILQLPIITEDTLNYIDKYLSGLTLHLIILTYSTNIPKRYACLDLNNRPINTLKEIYLKIHDNFPFSESEFCELCSYIDYNPYVISLIARLQKKAPALKGFFLDFDSWIWNHKSLPSLHALYYDSGKKDASNPKTLLQRLIMNFPDETFKKSLSELSIWTKHPISRTLLENGFELEVIDKAIDYGILIPEDNKVVMPALFADVIWNCPEYQISYQEYYDKISDFAEAINLGQQIFCSYSDLYPILLNMVFRFHFQITCVPSRITKTDRELLNQWNDILLQLIAQLLRLGHNETAKRIIPYLFYYTQKQKSEDGASIYQKNIRKLLQIHIELMNGTFDTQYIDSVINVLSSMSESAIPYKRVEHAQAHRTCHQYAHIILIDLFDHLIRTEKIFTLSYLQSPNQNDLVFLERIVKILEVHGRLYSNDLGHLDYYHFYAFVSSFIRSIYTTNYASFFERAIHHYYSLINSGTASSDLKTKALCLYWYYTIVFCLTKKQCPIDLSSMEHDYSIMYDEFSSKIHSWDTLWNFYVWTLLFLSYKRSFTPPMSTSLSILYKAVEQLPGFLNSQLSLSDSERDELNKLLEMSHYFH